MKKGFKCKVCGCTRLEEILVGVMQSTEVLGVEDLGNDNVAVEYGNTSTEGGELERYQCMECGDILTGEEREALQLPSILGG